jgi:hypothetical protein
MMVVFITIGQISTYGDRCKEIKLALKRAKEIES